MRSLLLLLFILLLAGIGFAVYGNNRLEESRRQLVETLWHDSAAGSPGNYHPDQLTRLPPPVQRYLRNVLTPGMPMSAHVRLKQHGIFNVGDRSPQWLPFKATSHVSTSPPGVVWDARLSIAPPVAIRVIDYYHGGKGGVYGRLLGALPVADALPAPELDQGELMAWLAESVRFPTVLLPGNGVGWEAIDSTSARATVDDGYQRVSLDFFFNRRDEVEQVRSHSRGKEFNGRYRMLPWLCRYRHYERINGALIPLEGEVLWQLPTGEWPYLRARIDQLDYDPPR